jgi:hypothetical protein
LNTATSFVLFCFPPFEGGRGGCALNTELKNLLDYLISRFNSKLFNFNFNSKFNDYFHQPLKQAPSLRSPPCPPSKGGEHSKKPPPTFHSGKAVLFYSFKLTGDAAARFAEF